MSEVRRLYKTGDAAKSLGISRSKLYELIARGAIGSVKIDGSRLVPASALDAYAARLCEEQGCEIAPDGVRNRGEALAAA